ncbi:MAG TPA: Spy/CpxP family protein refolding chaperone [Albitalea sp.]|nr:Spy/CpxP family protein refolding chaperone [Albitalea sp.]
MKIRHAVFAAAASALVAGALAQPFGMGPGMMGGDGGYGMGPGMMGSGYGMGPGMMGGYAGDAYAGLNLTPEQRRKIADIQQETSKAMWQLMGTMHQQGYHMRDIFGPGPLDEASARKAFQTMTETQKAMFELRLDARKRIDAVLTKDQREQLQRYWSSR